jgi:hypothetical protein
MKTTFLIAVLIGVLTAIATPVIAQSAPEITREERTRREALDRTEVRLKRIEGQLATLTREVGIDPKLDAARLIFLASKFQEFTEDLESAWISASRSRVDRVAEAKRLLPQIIDLQEVAVLIKANEISALALGDYLMPLIEGLKRRLRIQTLYVPPMRLHYLPDIPENHYIYEAWAHWTRAGLIEGRVSRLIRGGRAESNLSIAEMLRQAIRSVDKKLTQVSPEDKCENYDFVDSHELPLMESLVVVFGNELQFLGEDVDRLEALVSVFPLRLFLLREERLELTRLDRTENGPDSQLIADYRTIWNQGLIPIYDSPHAAGYQTRQFYAVQVDDAVRWMESLAKELESLRLEVSLANRNPDTLLEFEERRPRLLALVPTVRRTISALGGDFAGVGVDANSVRIRLGQAESVLRNGRSPRFGEAHEAFTDVPENHWASSSVQALRSAGLLRGYPSGRFARH